MPMESPSVKIAIELNDAGLIVVQGDAANPPSPGVAVWDGNDLFVGADAWSRFRRLPRDTNDRFWERLSQEPMDRPLGPARSSGDLVHRHLAEVWKSVGRASDGVLFTVTGAVDSEQVALLLGIAQSVGIPVSGVVDTGLACAMATPAGFSAVVHVDTQLHRAVVTRVEAGEMLVRARAAMVNPFGLKPLTDLWLRFLAQSFVRMTRFDPLDRGEDEQQLFDQLPACLAELKHESSAPLELHVHDRVHAITVKRDELVQIAQAPYRELLKEVDALCHPGETTLVQISSRLCMLPGFVNLVRSEISADVMELLPGAGPRSLLSVDFSLPTSGSGVPFLTRVARHGEALLRSSVTSPKTHNPTHLLGEHEAFALHPSPLFLVAVAMPERVEVQAEDPGTTHPCCSVMVNAGGVWLESQGESGVFLNGMRVQGRRALRVDDRIRIAGTLEEFALVTRGESNGA